VRQLTYDAAGNLVGDTALGRTTAYAYNAANRLASVTRAGATTATYRYDPRGQLAVRTAAAPTVAEQTTHYIHDRWGNVIAEAGADGVMRREYVWLPEAEIAPTAAARAAIAMPVAVIDAAATAAPVLYHVHADHLHRPLRMTAATGAAVLWQAEWLPWGEPAPGSLTSAPSLGLRFPGQWFQLETGLHYNWHRHYDPTLGRYTQPDPLGFVDGPSVYGYAGENPQALVDPDGRQIVVPGPLLPPVVLIGGGAYLLCQINPEACKKLKNWCERQISDWIGGEGANDNKEIPPGYCKATSLKGQKLRGGGLQCVYKCKDGSILVTTDQPGDAEHCRPTVRKPDRGPQDVKDRTN